MGAVHYIPLEAGASPVGMADVAGDPADVAVSADGSEIRAVCRPQSYTFNTNSFLCAWEAASGQRKYCRELRTTHLRPARLSRDGSVLVYDRFRDFVLLKNAGKLDRHGRIKNVRDVEGSAWLRDDDSFETTAHDVVLGDERVLASGGRLVGVADSGRFAAIVDADGAALCEELSTGRVYKVGFAENESIFSRELMVAFGDGGGVMVMGRTNKDLARFGWLGSELPDVKKLAEARTAGW